MDWRREWKVDRDGAVVICDGQRRADATGNALSPMVDSRVCWKAKDVDEAECYRCLGLVTGGRHRSSAVRRPTRICLGSYTLRPVHCRPHSSYSKSRSVGSFIRWRHAGIRLVPACWCRLLFFGSFPLRRRDIRLDEIQQTSVESR